MKAFWSSFFFWFCLETILDRIDIMNLSNKLKEKGGKFSFYQFMDTALYHPKHGFYRTGKVRFGKKGDFITHPELTSPYFARALVRQMASMWNEMERPHEFKIIEMGAGDGHLASDILKEAKEEFPSFYEVISLILIDISPELVRRQQKKISRVHHNKVEFLTGSILDHRWQEICGCFISNELFDSLPIHRVRKVEGELQEIYLEFASDGKIKETVGALSIPEIEEYFKRIRFELDEGQEFAVNTHAVRVIKSIARALKSGYHITIDYGTTADHLIAEDLSKIYTFKKQQRGSYPYIKIGQQDITATVDFSSLVIAGEESGLEKQILVDEYRFFKHWLGWKKDLDSGFDALKTLEPFFYDGFKVLIQSKNAPDVEI